MNDDRNQQDDDELLDFLDGAGKEVKPLGPPGLFHHFGQGLGDATMQGFARVGRAAAVLAPAIPEVFGTGLTEEGKDRYYAGVDKFFDRAVDYWTPNANNLGAAGQVTNSLVTGLTPLTLGPAGLVATTETDTAIEVARAGGSTKQAVAAGVVMGTATAAGVKMPNAFGTALPVRIATGAGANVALDAGGQVIAGEIVQGNPELEKRFEVTKESVALSALMGGVFGTLPDGVRAATTAERDAAATLNNGDHFANRTAPGEPTTRGAAVQHQDALATALKQAMAGEPVNVAGKVDPSLFRLRPELQPTSDFSASFEAAVSRLLKDEGGYSNDPVDRGGATNFGISSKAHPDVDVRNLTREQATAIYRERYWNAIDADALPESVRGAAFDAAVNQGVGWTKQALRESGGDTAAFLKLREQRYREIVAADPSQKKFLRGWLNRLGRYRETNGAGESLRERLVSDPEQVARDYAALEDSKGGTVLNTDTARELSPEYLADRTRSADVHEAASDAIKTIYETKLAQPTPEGFEPVVLFTAGGTGAGKTTAIQDAGGKFGKPEITYDTNMNTLSSAVDKVEQALAAGRDVRIAYVYRDPVEALTGGAIPRAQRQAEKFGSGRTVPLSEHAKTHVGVRPVMEALAEKYRDNPRVEIAAIDNSRGKGKSEVVPLESLPRVEQNKLHERLQEALDQARQDGLDEALHRGFSAAGRAETGPRVGAGDGRQPQPQDRGQVSGAETPLDAATKLAAESPDTLVNVAAEGDAPRYRSMADALDEIAAEQAAGERDASAFLAAASCALRNGVA